MADFSAIEANGTTRDLKPLCNFCHVLFPPVAHSVTGFDSSLRALKYNNRMNKNG